MGKQKAMTRERGIVIATALILSAAPTAWLVWPRSPRLDDPAKGYQAVCPPEPGQPLVVLTFDSRYHSPNRGASYTDVYERYVVYDPKDGRVLHREWLGEHRSEREPADCFGASGEHVWLWTDRDGYHVREARTGRVVRTQQELLGDLSANLVAAHFDPTTKQLFVSTKDGRTHAIDRAFARSVTAARPRTADRQAPGVPADREGRSVASYARGNKTSKGTLSETGRARKEILLDGERLADTDWLSPDYVLHRPSQALEWPTPPSLLVCEPPETGQPNQILTRLGLDGRILWTYRPEPQQKSSTGSNMCRWYVTADGTRLVTFVSNGMVAIDPSTGLEAFRRAL